MDFLLNGENKQNMQLAKVPKQHGDVTGNHSNEVAEFAHPPHRTLRHENAEAIDGKQGLISTQQIPSPNWGRMQPAQQNVLIARRMALYPLRWGVG